MRKSRVLEKLRRGECVISTQIGSGCASFAGMAASLGFDCLWLDMEHKPVSERQVRECIAKAAFKGADCVVRIKKRGYLDYFRPLEDGAAGIMVPHCMDRKDAEQAVRNARFYPQGLRGMDFTGMAFDYMTHPAEKCIEWALKETFVMVQIEDMEALGCIDEILDVEGVDILFIGPSDLVQSAKKHGAFSKGFLDKAFDIVSEAVKKYGNKWWGTVAGSVEQAERLRKKGAGFINISGDFGQLYNGWNKIMQKCIDIGL